MRPEYCAGPKRAANDSAIPCDGYTSRSGPSIIQTDPGLGLEGQEDLWRSDVFTALRQHSAGPMNAH